MVDFIREWIFNLAAVGILLVLIDILAPSGKSKKVINLVSGFILLLTIVQPFFNLFIRNIGFNEFYDQNNEYVEAIIANTGELNISTADDFNADELKKKQNKQIINLYGKRIEDNIQKLVLEVIDFQKVEVGLIINEDYNSQNYGEIKKIYVNAYLTETANEDNEGRNKSGVKIKKIEEVRIDPIKNDDGQSNNSDNSNNILPGTSNGKGDNKQDDLENELVKKLEDKISLATGVRKENIIVSVIRR